MPRQRLRSIKVADRQGGRRHCAPIQRSRDRLGGAKFPADAADLISRTIERDVAFYDPIITEEAILNLNAFAQAIGHLSGSIDTVKLLVGLGSVVFQDGPPLFDGLKGRGNQYRLRQR